MAGKITTNSVVLGDSITDTQNFVLKTNADGTATLARGALGALGTVFGVNGSGALTGATLVAPVINGFTGDTSVINIGSGQIYKDASGNVGIGTSSPSARLHVSTSAAGLAEPLWLNNSQAVGANVGSRLVFTGTSSNNGLAAIDGAFAGATTTDGGYMAFNTRAVTSGTLTEQARITAAGLLQFNSGYGSVATAYGCRAWVNFNGTGTVAIRGSGNVSSITDLGVGAYTVNFTTAMPDANYTILNNASDDSTAATISCTSGTWGGTTQTTTLARIFVGVAGAGNDRTYVGVSIFR